MSFILQPWRLLFIILAGWVNEQQQQVIEYLRAENQVLREKLGKKRILLSDDQRRRLAVKGAILGRMRWEQIGTLFTPDFPIRPSATFSKSRASNQPRIASGKRRGRRLSRPV